MKFWELDKFRTVHFLNFELFVIFNRVERYCPTSLLQCNLLLPFRELKKIECVSFVLALSTRTRVFPPASVSWTQAMKTAKVETKIPSERHVSIESAMLEERKKGEIVVGLVLKSLNLLSRALSIYPPRTSILGSFGDFLGTKWGYRF